MEGYKKIGNLAIMTAVDYLQISGVTTPDTLPNAGVVTVGTN